MTDSYARVWINRGFISLMQLMLRAAGGNIRTCWKCEP